MTGQELLDYLRVDVLRDSAAPYLWSDAQILRMLSEAEREFCRKTYALTDDTVTIPTVANTGKYTLADGSLYVLSAYIDGYSRDMGNYTRRYIPNNLATSTGLPQIYSCDEGFKQIRLYPIPDAVYTVVLRVARLPATEIFSYSTPEIPSEYHLDLAEYAAWRLLQSNDVDGTNLGASERHKKDWLQRVSDAKREYYRLRTGNNPTAITSWTFKRN